MSGTATTSGTGLTGVTADAVDAAPVASSTNAPAVARAPAQTQGGQGADMLTQSEWTRRVVALASVVVVGLSILAIVGVMCYRVAVDGNAPLTSTITSQLLWIALGGILSMTVALFGSNSLLAKLVEKVVVP